MQYKHSQNVRFSRIFHNAVRSKKLYGTKHFKKKERKKNEGEGEG